MNRLFSHIYIVLLVFVMMACQNEDVNATPPSDNGGSTNGGLGNGDSKTLIVYYSYTNNTEQIVADLKSLINADVVEIEPVNKNLDYAANGYAIGT